jgi:uncharacterized protein (UPF0332 family)
MKAKDIIINAIKRSAKERGLRVMSPNNYLSDGHIKKADHNLIVMTDLNKLGHKDWVLIAAYYAMYHAALALLAKIGLESKDHATTVAILEYFFGKQISKEIIEKFNELKERKDKIEAIIIEEKYINYLWKIKRARETVQYGIAITYKETDVMMNIAREFVSKVKLVINELDERLLNMINKEIRELKDVAAK